MEYCGNCGEPAEGRFCRMCGAPVGMAQVASPVKATPTIDGGRATAKKLAADDFCHFVGRHPAPYGVDQAHPDAVPDADPAERSRPPSSTACSGARTGSPGCTARPSLLPPVVESGLPDVSRLGGGATTPPGAAEYDRYLGDDDEPRSNRPVILATVGAVIVAAAVILGLLYLGNQSTQSPTGGSTAAGGAARPPPPAKARGPPARSAIPSDGAKVPSLSASTPRPRRRRPRRRASAAFQRRLLRCRSVPAPQGGLVKWVQERLKQLGYYQGSTDGTFDQATAAAVQQFQATAGVTGDPASTVGLHTLVALEAAGSTPNLRTGSRSPEVGRLNLATAELRADGHRALRRQVHHADDGGRGVHATSRRWASSRPAR